MTTKRTPKKAATKIKVTDHAVELFKQLRSLPVCVCQWGPNYWDRVVCISCDQWTELSNQLHRELGLFVGDYPAVSNGIIDTPPYDEIEGGKLHVRCMPHEVGPGHYDDAQMVFEELMRRAARDEEAEG